MNQKQLRRFTAEDLKEEERQFMDMATCLADKFLELFADVIAEDDDLRDIAEHYQWFKANIAQIADVLDRNAVTNSRQSVA